MSNYYDNSIVPNELKRNFDVYDRIKELNIDLGSYNENVNDITSGGLPIATVLFHQSGLVYLSGEGGGEPIGFITSPWYHPEKKQNIAMGYVPYDGTLNANGFPKGKVGTKYRVHLPEKYSDKPGQPVDAVVVDIPFKESYNANTREVVKG